MTEGDLRICCTVIQVAALGSYSAVYIITESCWGKIHVLTRSASPVQLGSVLKTLAFALLSLHLAALIRLAWVTTQTVTLRLGESRCPTELSLRCVRLLMARLFCFVVRLWQSNCYFFGRLLWLVPTTESISLSTLFDHFLLYNKAISKKIVSDVLPSSNRFHTVTWRLWVG